MKEVSTLAEAVEELKSGGIILIPSQKDLKIGIVFKENKPEEIFDHINKFELSLIKSVNNDIKMLDSYSKLSDAIRTSVIKEMTARNIDCKSFLNYPHHLDEEEY